MQDADDALKAKIREIQRTHGYAIGFRDELGRLDVRPPGPDDPVPDLPGLPPRAGLSPLLIQLFSTAGMKRRVGGKAVPLAAPVEPIVNAQTAENMRKHADTSKPWGRPAAPAGGLRSSMTIIDDPIIRDGDTPEHRAKVRASWAEARRRARKGSHRR